MLNFRQKIERRLKKILLKITGKVLAVERRCAQWLHPFNGRGQILFQKNYTTTPSDKRLCIFAHFDQGGHIDAYVLHYLTQLKAQGCDIVFVTTSPKAAFLQHLPAIEAQLSALVHKVIVRKNLSLDFGSYFIGLKACDLNGYEHLLFCNDSVYGPFRDLQADFARGEAYDVWGYTASLEKNYHIQSYFTSIKLTALSLQAILAWQKDFLYYRFKGNVIAHGELKLTKYFTALGLQCEVLYPCAELMDTMMAIHTASKAREKIVWTPIEAYIQNHYDVLVSKGNTSHSYWFILTTLYRFPFIKRELIDLNPLDTTGVNNWQAIIQQEFDVDMRLYDNHQKRLR